MPSAFPSSMYLHGGLRGEAAFGERAGRELVRRAADRVAGAEQAFDRHHAVVAPEILGRGNVLRTLAQAPEHVACEPMT